MFTTLFVQPIYNLFIALLGIMPGGDVGWSIVALTLLVRIVFYPIFTSSIRSQMAMQAVQPELAVINEQYKDDAGVRAQKTAELFTKHRIRPLSLIFSTVVQVVVFIALSIVFFRMSPPTIHTNLLYSFVPAPSSVNTHFLGLLDTTASHYILLTALITALQYYAIRLSLDRTRASTKNQTEEQLAAQKMQRTMMLVLLPVMVAVFSYSFPAGIGIYMAVTSLVSIAQELVIKQRPL